MGPQFRRRDHDAAHALQASGAPAIAGIQFVAATPAEVNGNGNGTIDAGEDWKLDIVLGNGGGIAATGVVATLTSNTPGVSVTSPPVPYPAIAVNAIASNPAVTPFKFSVFGLPCGTDIAFTLSVATAQSPSPHVFPIVLKARSAYRRPSAIPGLPSRFRMASARTSRAPPLPSACRSAARRRRSATSDLRIDGLNGCSPNNAANAGIDHTSLAIC
jgi:hypothetical protein